MEASHSLGGLPTQVDFVRLWSITPPKTQPNSGESCRIYSFSTARLCILTSELLLLPFTHAAGHGASSVWTNTLCSMRGGVTTLGAGLRVELKSPDNETGILPLDEPAKCLRILIFTTSFLNKVGKFTLLFILFEKVINHKSYISELSLPVVV